MVCLNSVVSLLAKYVDEYYNAVMDRRFLILGLLGFAFMASCQTDKDVSLGEGEPVGMKKVRFKTSEGDIVLELDGEKAPITVRNFVKYVEAGYFDNTVFHRVVKGPDIFVVQGGGFKLDDGHLVEKKVGNPIRNEAENGLKNDRGTISMARTQDPHSATTQFFLNTADNVGLNFPTNNGYAVFGKVVEGMDVVDKIQNVKTAQKTLIVRNGMSGGVQASPSQDVPVEDVVIVSVKVE
jgi:cyclophilin family peptidyl-prolyl cis-trans isomerase